MINIGALDDTGAGRFVLPAGISIRDYAVIDVSAQNFDGNPAPSKACCEGH